MTNCKQTERFKESFQITVNATGVDGEVQLWLCLRWVDAPRGVYLCSEPILSLILDHSILLDLLRLNVMTTFSCHSAS
jgi:hypothetical protein